jgi:hypothetical protein
MHFKIKGPKVEKAVVCAEFYQIYLVMTTPSPGGSLSKII